MTAFHATCRGSLPPIADTAFGGIVRVMSTRSNGERQDPQVTSEPELVRSAIADYYKRMAGLLPVTVLGVLIIQWLPLSPEGNTEALPLFVVGAALVGLSAGLLWWLQPRPMLWKWTLRWVLGLGMLFCLAAPLAGI